MSGKGYLTFDPQLGPGANAPLPLEGYAGGSYTQVDDVPLLTDASEYYLNDRAQKSPCTS